MPTILATSLQQVLRKSKPFQLLCQYLLQKPHPVGELGDGLTCSMLKDTAADLKEELVGVSHTFQQWHIAHCTLSPCCVGLGWFGLDWELGVSFFWCVALQCFHAFIDAFHGEPALIAHDCL